jgi:hypothetical protein
VGSPLPCISCYKSFYQKLAKNKISNFTVKDCLNDDDLLSTRTWLLKKQSGTNLKSRCSSSTSNNQTPFCFCTFWSTSLQFGGCRKHLIQGWSGWVLRDTRHYNVLKFRKLGALPTRLNWLHRVVLRHKVYLILWSYTQVKSEAQLRGRQNT